MSKNKQKMSAENSDGLQRFKNQSVLVGFLLILVSLFFVFVSINHRDLLLRFAKLGYAGLFITNFIGSAAIFTPAPVLIASFFGGNILNPVLVGFFSGLGSALGDLLGFLFGYGARTMINGYLAKGKWLGGFEDWFRKNSFLAIFILAFIPNPIFDACGLLSGALKVKPQNFFLATLLGRLLRNYILAFSGQKILG